MCFRLALNFLNPKSMGLGLFARKLRMTRLFDETGVSFAVTVLKVEQCLVSQIKTVQTDGYNGIQVAYNLKQICKLNKAQLGLSNKLFYTPLDEYGRGILNLDGAPKSGFGFGSFGEFRVDTPEKFAVGDLISVSFLDVGQTVWVKGNCVGKGFMGNQKRHNFSRGPLTHGSKNHRLPGSIGAASTPARVYPGRKMAGRRNNKMLKRVRAKVVFINEKEQVVVLKGSVPGNFNAFLKLECIPIVIVCH
jgi:large subunit ribosomal protein L3